MRGYNKAVIMGNIARDPEIRYTASQKAVATFSVAVNRRWTDQNGELRDEVTFIPVVVWGKQAEFCERYLRKGSAVFVDGRINVRNYEAKTGERRYVTEIVAETVQSIGARRDDAGSPQSSSGGSQGYAGGSSQNFGNSYGASSFGGDSDYQPRQASSAPRSYRSSQSETESRAFEGAFPMDISELDSAPSSPASNDDEADIPF